jgi:hypothetical protein
VLENIFTFNGKAGHEIVLLYEIRFHHPEDGDFEEMPIIENGAQSSKAVWKSFGQIKTENRPLYPEGLEGAQYADRHLIVSQVCVAF